MSVRSVDREGQRNTMQKYSEGEDKSRGNFVRPINTIQIDRFSKLMASTVEIERIGEAAAPSNAQHISASSWPNVFSYSSMNV